MDFDQCKKKLQTTFKFSGFHVRQELCRVMLNKLLEANVPILSDQYTFDSCMKNFCTTFQSHCSSEHSIEEEHILIGVDVYLCSGYEKTETIFNVISAFDIPRLVYNLDTKQYRKHESKPKLLANADSRSNLFMERYQTILQRTKRSFKNKSTESSSKDSQLSLQSVDYLLTVNKSTLNRTLILGCLTQIKEGRYYLEDPTGLVELDFTHAKFHGGFFVENTFVLINGEYEEKVLHVATVILPPGEQYLDSRPGFGNINYFGGLSTMPLKDSIRLQEYMTNRNDEFMLFFSDVWLDHSETFTKLDKLFGGLQECAPIAFVFMGNFLCESYGSEILLELKKRFKHLADILQKYPTLTDHCNFVFVPGMSDPCMPHIAPRPPLPSFTTEDLSKVCSKVFFATNPCRIQYCTREICLFRADLLTKLLQGSLYKPEKTELADHLARTICSQGHLSPFSLNALTIHWDYDYALRLYPLPDIVVIGDRAEMYNTTYKDCHIINPGSFCDNEFSFKSYIPASNKIDECKL